MLEEILNLELDIKNRDKTDAHIDKIINFLESQSQVCEKLTNELYDDGFIYDKIISSLDISLADIEKHKKQYDLLLEANGIGTWIWRCNENIIKLNKILLEKFGVEYEPYSETLDLLIHRIHLDDIDLVLSNIELAKQKHSRKIEFKCRIKHQDGTYLWVKITGNMTKKDTDDCPVEYFGIIEDITKRVQRQDILKNLGSTDILTSSKNRLYFDKYLERVLSNKNNKKSFGILALVDVDHFKKINDTYGHDMGDEVLKIIANILEKTIGDSGVVARLGGEEFGILLPYFHKEDAKNLLEKIQNNIRNYSLKDIDKCLENTSLSITIGFTRYKNGQKSHNIFKIVDNAMYEGKAKGRDCIVYGDNVYEKQ